MPYSRFLSANYRPARKFLLDDARLSLADVPFAPNARNFFILIHQVLLLTLAIGFLSGCASSRLSQELLSAPPEHLPLRHEIHQVPFYPQELYQCGPASLAEILNYRGRNVSPEELKSEVYIPERQGSLQLELIGAVRSRSFLAYRLSPTLKDLVAELAADNPVLVLQNLSLPWYPLWHYAVVIGYDLNRRELILRSGTTERLTVPLRTFEKTWARGDHWALVVLPPGVLPATAEEFPYVKAAQELEAVGQVHAAHQSYQAAHERWPDSSIALMGLGNTAYTLKNYVQAENAFVKLLEKDPISSAAWNNYAYAMLARGCDDSAIKAAECAVQLAPDDHNVIGTLIDVTQQASKRADEPGASPSTVNPSSACRQLHCPVPQP